jgi:hypothetical protein
MNCFLALVGLGVIAAGLFVAFNIDFMWKLKEGSNAFEGVKSERTEAWEQKNSLTGVLIIVAGVGLIIYSFVSG